jgi:molybdopterin biosynthesis enzyme
MSLNGVILGLPGNLSSAFVCVHLLLRPLIDKLIGRAPVGVRIGPIFR